MIELLSIAGGLILAMLGFLLKFIGSLCMIALVMIVFVILTVFIIGFGWVLGTLGLEFISDKYSIFDKGENYEERDIARNNNPFDK